jgi:hypothetical protein
VCVIPHRDMTGAPPAAGSTLGFRINLDVERGTIRRCSVDHVVRAGTAEGVVEVGDEARPLTPPPQSGQSEGFDAMRVIGKPFCRSACAARCD